MSWAYSPSYGKPLSVPQGIIGLMTRFGMNVTLAHPEGYGLIPDVVELAKKNSAKCGGKFEVVSSMEEAFRDADVVYPKSWAPYAVMQRRTPLLQKGDRDGLKALEKECLANNARFKNWECDEKKMKLTEARQGALPALPAGGHLGRELRAGRGLGGGVREIPHRDVSRGELQAVRHRGDDFPGAGERFHGHTEETNGVMCEGSTINQLRRWLRSRKGCSIDFRGSLHHELGLQCSRLFRIAHFLIPRLRPFIGQASLFSDGANVEPLE